MKKYQVKFIDDTGTHSEQIEGVDPGNAFVKCQKLHPGAKMIEAVVDGSFWGGYGYTKHVPPPVQRDHKPEPRPYRAPKPAEKDGIMPFYDEVVRREA